MDTRSKIAVMHRRLGIATDYGASRKLTLQREPRRLVYVGRSPFGRRILLTPRAAAAWRKMHGAAAADGVELIAISGFRSEARQERIIRAKLAAGIPLAAILRVVAAPGFSEHHTGRALDIGCPGHTDVEPGFGRTATFRWLQRNARRFGFTLSYPRRNPHGIAYEPWHWRFS